MRASFGYIFWGLILVVLDFRINGFDLIPDFVGYALVGVGAAGLSQLSAQFITAGALSSLLAVCDIVGMVTPTESAFFGILVTIINCAMIWNLLGGVIVHATDRGRPDLAERAANRRIWYVGIMAVATALGLSGKVLGSAVAIVVVPLVVAGIVVMIMILHLIHRVRYELDY